MHGMYVEKYMNEMFNQLQQYDWIESSKAYLLNKTPAINRIKGIQRLITV
jgi:hypothetical protein